MDLLNELVFVLSKSGNISTFSAKLPAKTHSKSRVLFDALIDGRVKTDAEAAELIYGTSPKDKKYLMLKRSLVNKLTQTILETEYSEIGEQNYVAIAFDCREKLSVAERLLKQNVFHNAEKIIRKTSEVARAFQLNEVKLDALKLLRIIYSLNGDVKNIGEVTLLIDQLYEELGQQTKAEGFLQTLRAKLLYSIARSAKIEQEAQQAIIQIENWQRTNKNIFLENFRLLIRIYQQRMTATPENVLLAVEAHERFLTEFPFRRTRNIAVFHAQETLRARLAQGNFEEAIPLAEAGVALSDYRSFEKFEMQTLHFELCMKRSDYKKAGEILLEVEAAPQFEYVYKQDRAAWLVRQAYLYYALLVTNAPEDIARYCPFFNQHFSVNNFATEAKAVQKDKQGYNVLFLLINLFFTAEKNSSTIDYDGASLKIYYHRHLRLLQDLRMQVFFRWCYQLASRHFQLNERYGLDYILDELNRVKGIQSSSCEIIPFDTLAHWIVARYCPPSKT